MARFRTDFPDDFLSNLTDYQFEVIAEPALEAAAPALKKSMKKAARAAIMHEGESEMVESIDSSKPVRTKTDAYIVNVGPTGKSSHTYYASRRMRSRKYKYQKRRYKTKYLVNNALKGIWMEYGINTPNHHQPPRPFLEKSTKDANAEVMKKMQEVYDQIVK